MFIHGQTGSCVRAEDIVPQYVESFEAVFSTGIK